MAKWSDFFSMTRHERTGALVVLALIVAAVVAQWAIPRCSHEETPPLTDEQLSRFQRETDTSLVVERGRTTSRRHRRDTTQARARSRKPRSSTSTPTSAKQSPSSSHNQRNDVVPNEN